MKIFEQIKNEFLNCKGEVFSTKEIKDRISKKYKINKNSIIPSDYCYNRINRGITFTQHFFIQLNRNEYYIAGENYQYDGRIYWKPKKSKKDIYVGNWDNGKFKLFFDIFSEIEMENEEIDTYNMMNLGKNEIKKLYEEYMTILNLEVNIFHIKPTEVRHLIGRLGEFKCAIMLNGSLSHIVNQHGFDVISNNKRVSVKTTAQKMGFVSFNKKTIHLVDEVMILQYINNEFIVIYYGDINTAIECARSFNGKYELDLSRIKKLKSKII